jgi:hypothetical protein|tara:strand:+ start:194 stop:1117 length:924 start_codon:yes stop_codon:yes gene_type:complete
MEEKDMLSNRYPVYVVSKGRAHSRLTMKALDRMSVFYKVVVEQDEFELYAEHLEKNRLLVLPEKYKEEYDLCDQLGFTRSTGPGPARNYVWDLSQEAGDKRHWVMDDNLDDFHRLNRNMKVPVRSPATLCASEDFVDRFKNVPLAGMNYYSFCKSTDSVPPFVANTRIYSCLLIENSAPYRWRGRYNEDTDLSLRVLKDGLCTIQFNAFLCGKVTTQRMKGGNTEEFYAGEGTFPKSQMIADLHPDVAKVVWRFNRWHHHVDYNSFKDNELEYKEGFIRPFEENNYNMRLVDYGMKAPKDCGAKDAK